MAMRRCPTNRFEDEPYNITGMGGEGEPSLSSLSYYYPVFVVFLVIIAVINFIIEDLDNLHVEIRSNSRNAELLSIIGGVDAYIYQLSGISPG